MAKDRNITLRENYNRLRAAGFSSAEATRYRGASEELIQAAINAKQLPELREEKTGARKTKVKEKEYKHSNMVLIQVLSLSERHLKAAYNQFVKYRSKGFNYYSTKIIFHMKQDEESQAYSDIGGMDLSNKITGPHDLLEKLNKQLETLINIYLPGEQNFIERIEYFIYMWKAKGAKRK
jgi:hypothetical protein